MKLRNGFVSNSSSSSFIIYDKNKQEKVKKILDNECYLDYYEIDGTLYTSFISDAMDIYNKVANLSDNDVSGQLSGVPYDWEDEELGSFIQFEGDRGCGSVYVDKKIVQTSEKANMWQELLAIQNPEVERVLKKYKRVIQNEIEKWLCQ